MQLKLIPAIILLTAVCSGCRSGLDCKVNISSRRQALRSLNARTFCVSVFTGGSIKYKKEFNLSVLAGKHLTGLLVDGSSMPSLKSQVTAKILLKQNILQLTSFAETCQFIGCPAGLLCVFSEYRGSGNTRSVKVTLSWVDAEKSKIIALATGVADLKKSSEMEDFKLYCGEKQQPADFIDFAAFRVINRLFNQVKKIP